MGWSLLASDVVTLVTLASQFGMASLTVLILVRILYILSANPIGEFAQELVYLRGVDLRRAGYLIFVAVLLEVVQLVYPFAIRQGWLKDVPDVNLFTDAVQAFLILSCAITILIVVRRYTHRALDRRIRESMETLAYLEGQRRRRRAVEAGEWRAPVDED